MCLVCLDQGRAGAEYLQPQRNGDEKGEQQPVATDISLTDLKGFLKEELQSISSDIKQLKCDFKIIDTRLTMTEGGLSKFENVIGHLESEMAVAGQKN